MTTRNLWWVLVLGCSPEAEDVVAPDPVVDASGADPRAMDAHADSAVVVVDATPRDAAPPNGPDASPVDAARADAAPVDAAPVDAAPVDAAPVDAAPVDAAPVDAAPVDAAPVDAAPDACPAPGTFYADVDEDGFGDPATAVEACGPPPGHVDRGEDCDDARAESNPDEVERCNGIDDDCDGLVDNRAIDRNAYFADADGDGAGDAAVVRQACAQPEGFVEDPRDCNDEDPAVGACGAGERCSVARRCIGPGACVEAADCDQLTVCEGGTCVPGSPCGGVAFGLARVQPSLLVVLDRSCSMRNRVAGVRKWQAAVDAINAMTREFEASIRFGLSLFPDKGDGSNCRQGDLVLPIADGNAPRVQALLTAALDNNDRYWPNGPCVTNIDTAMEQAGTDPALGEGGFVMLVTDGRQAGCNRAGGDAGTTRLITALAARGVNTFVVGFGGAVDPAQLAEFSRVGGVPRAGNPNYYQADDPEGLLAQLRGIAEQIADCTFELNAVPPDPARVAAFFNDVERVPRDVAHMEGWDYAAATNTVTFYGRACQRIDDGDVQDVDVVFGCDSGMDE